MTLCLHVLLGHHDKTVKSTTRASERSLHLGGKTSVREMRQGISAHQISNLSSLLCSFLFQNSAESQTPAGGETVQSCVLNHNLLICSQSC